MAPILEAKNLTKLYGIVMGLNDVTFEMSGGVFGLLGPNGAGKSTLLKLITGQLRPTQGTIQVFGEKPWNRPKLFRRIGFCPEQDAFYSFLSGREFVTTLGRVAGLSKKDAAERADVVLEEVGATEYMNRQISTYSKGMRQRTKVAQALLMDPDLLILDEPLTGTDPIGRRELMDLVVKLGARGKSILVASHVLHEVQQMTDQFMLIYGGRVLASGNVHEIRNLMDENPHRIVIRCENARDLAHHMLRDLPISGVELNEEYTSVTVRTRSPQDFYGKLPDVVAQSQSTIHEMLSLDDNLEAVFRYLVSGEA